MPEDTPTQPVTKVETPDKKDLNTLLESIEKSLSEGNPVLIRQAYDLALAQYPTSSFLWLTYAQYESRLHNYTELEAIFSRHLRQSLDVPFWSLYLRHVRWVAATDSSHDDGVIKAYELAVSQIGLDFEAGPIWNEYLHALKSQIANGLLEQQQQMETIRRTFHRVLQIPIQGLEVLWSDYEAWETQLNKLTVHIQCI